MNMPPPHGHPSHPGMGASSPSPGMMNRPHPHAQQFIPQHPQQQQQQQQQQHHYFDSPTPASARGRKRKLTAQHPHPHPHQQPQHLASRPSMHAPPPHPAHPHHPHQGYPGRPSHAPFLGLNLPPTIADEMPESIFDDLDRLTARDIAVARYARNHELLSMIFDARRIDTLTPAPSPYADVKQQDLKQKVKAIQEDVARLEKEHSEKLRFLKEDANPNKAHRTKGKSEDGDSGEVPVWAENASRGRILGVGFVRAETPEQLRPPKAVAADATNADDAMMEAGPQTAADLGDAETKDNTKVAEEEAARRQAEKEAIAKLNLELGVTKAAAEPEAALAPAPTTSTPTPVPAAAAKTKASGGVAAAPAPAATSTEAQAQPPAALAVATATAAAEEPPTAPVLAPAEVPAQASSDNALTTTEVSAPVSATDSSTADAPAAAVGEIVTEATDATEGAVAVPAIRSEDVQAAPAEASDITMADPAPATDQVAQAISAAVDDPADEAQAQEVVVAAVAGSAPEAVVPASTEETAAEIVEVEGKNTATT